MKIDVTSLLFVFGALQALLMLVGINLKQPFKTNLKIVLSTLLFAMFVALSYYVIVINELYSVYPYIDSLGMASWMAIAPLFYLLCRLILEPKLKLKWTHLIYFPISILYLIEGLSTTLGSDVWIYDFINDPQLFLDLWMAVFFLTSLFFMGKSVISIEQQAENQNRGLKWFAYSFLGMLVIFGVVYLFLRSKYVVEFEYILILLLEVLIFIFAFRVFKGSHFKHVITQNKEEKPRDSGHFERNALRLEKALEDSQPYLNKKLKLSDLAEVSRIDGKQLSQLFSSHYNSNFYDFINQYRLNHFEKLLTDSNFDQYNIMALAEDSGFNSKATFYKVFKEKYQLTPTQYLKKQHSD